ncbi:MAG: isoleucine--tRNA ligase, partial [Pelagibacteraceae bacterium TMED233]
NNKFINYFKNYDFHNLYKELLNFCTVDLSSFYFDIRKDTLYCDSKNSKKRKDCILVLNIILEALLKWFAPILSFTTEEIFTLVHKDKKSIHLENFIQIPKIYFNQKLNEKWDVLKKIREVCNISIEEKRANKEIGSSLEANLIISLDDKKTSIVQDIDFSELCITSSATLEKNTSEEILVKTTKAEGNKCPRCWKIFQTSCKRCENAKIN